MNDRVHLSEIHFGFYFFFFFSTKMFELLHAALKDEESGVLYLLLLSLYSTKRPKPANVRLFRCGSLVVYED